VSTQQSFTDAIAALQARDYTRAEAGLRQVIAGNPNHVDALSLLGVVCNALQRYEHSAKYFERAASLEPNPERLCNWGAALARLGRLNDAETAYYQALVLDAEYVEAHRNYGVCRLRSGDLESAERHFRDALRLRPHFPEAINNLIAVLRGRQQFDEAIEWANRLVALQPSEATYRFELGALLHQAGRLADATAAYAEAVRLKPDYAGAHLNRGLTLLALGEFKQGWPAFEWRWKALNLLRPQTNAPTWDGSDPKGKRFLLWAEQGIGDTLHFIRYASLLKERGAHVISRSPASLMPLLARTPGIDQLVAENEPIPTCDVHAPLITLPAFLGTNSPERIPANIPYVHADPSLIDRWRDRIQSIDGFRIGVCWQGNRQHPDDAIRSFPADCFDAIAKVPGVQLISLQKGEATPPGIHAVEGLDELSGPFMDTAAVMRHLNLVIACDSAIGHLAGAMGVPVWLALHHSADWRWLTGRSDTPWYPSMRLFRQRLAGNWGEVFSRIAGELLAMTRGRTVTVEISPGELFDKLTILTIKIERLKDEDQVKNVRAELAGLEMARDRSIIKNPDLDSLVVALLEVNGELWDIEELIRECERDGDFGERFLHAARAVIRLNHRRTTIKRRINSMMDSPITEEKSYLTP
jgi:Flp pilus assembly protein TadD